MLVIEGYAGKSLAVAEYIDTLNNQDVLIITCDKSALNSMTPIQTENKVYYVEQSNVKDIEDTLGLNTIFKHVIFYQNVKREDIDIFKKMEHVFDLQAVLTVQTPDRENRKPREVTKYTV